MALTPYIAIRDVGHFFTEGQVYYVEPLDEKGKYWMVTDRGFRQYVDKSVLKTYLTPFEIEELDEWL